MKCFTFFHGEVTPGILTTKSLHSDRKLVYLGQKGVGSRYQIVFPGSKKGKKLEIDENGLILSAYPKTIHPKTPDGEIDPDGFPKLILVDSYQEDGKILLRVNTSTQSDVKTVGKWETVFGWPEAYAKSNGNHNKTRWCDDILVLDDQDIICVHPLGGRRSDRKIIINECGEPLVLPELEYLQKVENYNKAVQDGSAKGSEIELREKIDDVVQIAPLIESLKSETKTVIHIEEDDNSFSEILPEVMDQHL